MKKACLIGITARLALAVFSCGDFGIPQDEGVKPVIVGYTADGRAIMEVELGVGLSDNARALHPVLAKAASDFYEVIFFDGTGIYRASWREGRTARLRLPAADYFDSPNYAYIFGGRYEDKMLLGVGTIEKIDGAAVTTTANVTTTTTSIDFLLKALETDVTAVQTTSTFKPAAWQVQTLLVNEELVPVFMLPANNSSSPAAATFNITCANSDLLDQIVYTSSTKNGKYISKPYAWIDSIDDLPIDLAGVTFTDTFTLNTKVTLPIGLSITTSPDNSKGKGGLCLLGIEIPVYLKTNATAANGQVAKTWYLKGGLNNSILDMGKVNTGMGGAVLIGSGNVLNGNGIEIGGHY